MTSPEAKTQLPVVIEFAAGSQIVEESFILLPSGERISLPSDQIVHSEDANGSAKVGLGGMSFEGQESGRFVFWRVKDLLPEEFLPSSREDLIALDPSAVSSISIQGTQVWPKA